MFGEDQRGVADCALFRDELHLLPAGYERYAAAIDLALLAG